MKNEQHLAYKVSYNYPLHIASPDSVQAHINDEVRLIVMNPAEFPKVRGRHLKNPVITSEVMDGDVNVKVVTVDIGDGEVEGRLYNDKYFMSMSATAYVPSVQLLFASFKKAGIKPMVRREWSWDYPSSQPAWYALVEEHEEEFFNIEQYYHIRGYEELNIDCLADILAYSYKFKWSNLTQEFHAITNPHEITMRLRKPWMTHLTQTQYGESPHTNADMSKLLTYLVQKLEPQLPEEEKLALEPFLGKPVSVDTLTRLSERQEVLNSLLDAYTSTELLYKGMNIKDDPLFGFIDNNIKRGIDARRNK